MTFKIGDIVSRKSHHHDVIFKITDIQGDIIILSGVNYRLCADALITDLVKHDKIAMEDDEIIQRNVKSLKIDRDKYFYLPGNILHIDGDSEYLDRCMRFYQNMGIKANGLTMKEAEIPSKILSFIQEYRPDILVITGHDAFYKKLKDQNDSQNYENSNYFSEAIKQARKYEKNQDKLIIIAGACQSNYEELIKAGANFASSPKRVNIHALDPAIIAASIAFSDKNQSIDLISLIEKTKYGSDGIGGIITNGTMYVGYPR